MHDVLMITRAMPGKELTMSEHEDIDNTAGKPKRAKYTVASTPPVAQESQKRSRWAELFKECRAVPGEWRRVIAPQAKATAAQIASDIRNAHTRDLDKARLRGLLPTDRWEASWGNDPVDSDPEHFYVWLRYVGHVAEVA
jgi:hypothetical protein